MFCMLLFGSVAMGVQIDVTARFLSEKQPMARVTTSWLERNIATWETKNVTISLILILGLCNITAE